jgi:hypothetical protein
MVVLNKINLLLNLYYRIIYNYKYLQASAIKYYSQKKLKMCGKIRFIPFGRNPDGFNVVAPSLIYKPVSFYTQMF